MCLYPSEVRRIRISIALRLHHLAPRGTADRAALLSAYGTSERIVQTWTRARESGVSRADFVNAALEGVPPHLLVHETA